MKVCQGSLVCFYMPCNGNNQPRVENVIIAKMTCLDCVEDIDVVREYRQSRFDARECFECGKVGKANKCKGCGLVKYCSTICQKKAYPLHKSFCRLCQNPEDYFFKQNKSEARSHAMGIL